MVLHDFVKMDKSRFNDAVKAYFLWKELNALIKNSHKWVNKNILILDKPIGQII